MSAKVFAHSNDVIEDQARILCEYLSQVAQKIVNEEMRLEGEISKNREELSQNEKMAKNKRLSWILFFAGAGVFVIIALLTTLWLLIFTAGLGVAGAVFFLGENKHKKECLLLTQTIDTFQDEFTRIPRDYKVHRLGVAYVPVATRIPFEEKSFLLDHTKTVDAKEFSLFSVKNQAEFVRNIQELETALEQIPMVEGTKAMEEVNTGEYSQSIQQISYYDYLGGIDRNMRAASFYLNDLEHNSVSIPVIDPLSPYASFLREYGTTEPTYGPVITVFPTDEHSADLQRFESLNEMKRTTEGQTAQFDEFLQGLMTRLASTIQMVTKIKIGSTDHIVSHANQILFASLKSSYNHYSPILEAEEIERIRGERFDYQESVETYRPFELKKTSRVLFDIVSDNWVSGDGRRTSYPFAVHQIHEEIVAPIVKSLMLETRIERLKIYNGIKDQKLNYLNQWHRDTDDFYGRNRAEGADLLNLMQGSLTEFTAAFNQYKAFEETQKTMTSSGTMDLSAAQVKADGSSVESIAVYEKKSEEFQTIQKEFNEYVDRLKEDIDRRAEKFGYIEFFDASLPDSGARDFAGSMSRMDSLEGRRKNLLGINPYFAETADLPPVPHVGEEVLNGLSLNLVKTIQDWQGRSIEKKEDPDGSHGPTGGIAGNTSQKPIGLGAEEQSSALPYEPVPPGPEETAPPSTSEPAPSVSTTYEASEMEAETKRICRKCGTAALPEDKFCSGCGEAIE